MEKININYSFNSSSLSHNNDDITFIDSFRDVDHSVLFDKTIYFDDYVFFLFCTKGHASIFYKSSSLSISEADILCCAPNSSLHITDIDSSFDAKIIWFSTKCLLSVLLSDDALLRQWFIMFESPIHRLSDDSMSIFSEYIKLFKLRFNRRLKDNTIPNFLIVSSFVYDLSFCDNNYPQNPSFIGKKLSQSKIIFKKFLWLLYSEPKKTRPVSYYANKLNITSKYLSFVVKQNCGEPTHKFITHFLIQHIKNLLADPRVSIKEIAYSMDFSSMTFFSKFVRANIGMSPSEYRHKVINSL